jgi:phenylpropionate dioxygenase-like ring-hydroxylating dioxygenase large terminal subunit
VKRDYDSLVDVKRGLISREIFVNGQIFDDELEHLFSRAWLFVGHTSLIPNADDFFVSRMGTESVILCRDRQHKVHVFLNTCRHRGMKVCRYDQGNTPVFTCSYHAWSYATDGKLVGVPLFEQIYAGTMSKDDAPLIEVAQMVDYKGTIWATWDPDAAPFEAYMGGALTYLDLVLDSRDGREGGSEVLDGVQKWVIPSNWKFSAENFSGDRYHNVSHKSADDTGIGPSARSGLKGRRDQFSRGSQNVLVTFPSGHGTHSILQPEDNAYVETYNDNPEVEAYYRKCFDERKRRLGEKSRLIGFNGTFFPNASYLANQPRMICVWHPVGPTTTEVWRFYLVDRDAPEAVKAFLRHYYMRYSGPAGMTEQDDMENWDHATAASRGPIARRYPYIYQQSLGASKIDDPLPGLATTAVSEQNPRGFYHRWVDYVSGRDWATLTGQNDKLRV